MSQAPPDSCPYRYRTIFFIFNFGGSYAWLALPGKEYAAEHVIGRAKAWPIQSPPGLEAGGPKAGNSIHRATHAIVY